MNHWQTLLGKTETSLAPGYNHLEDSAHVSLKMSGFDFDEVQRRSQTVFHAGLQDLLLTVLSRAFHTFGGSLSPVITLEGHGRENSDTRLDVSNTVGWFTVMYPFELPCTKDVSAHIQQVAAALIRVPNKGIGFGALHGYSNIPRVTFNHLGKIPTRNVSNAE